MRRLLLVVLLAPLCLVVAKAAPILATVTASGPVTGSVGVLADGIVPAQRTAYTSSQNVSWSNPAITFTFDLGSVQPLASLLLAVDNNDDYLVTASTNGVAFAPLFTVRAADGAVTPAEGGTDIFSSDPTSFHYLAGSGFTPVSARYLQLSGSGGDFIYTAGELDAFAPAASAVPEPSAFAMLLTGLAAMAMVRRRGMLTPG